MTPQELIDSISSDLDLLSAVIDTAEQEQLDRLAPLGQKVKAILAKLKSDTSISSGQGSVGIG